MLLSTTVSRLFSPVLLLLLQHLGVVMLVVVVFIGELALSLLEHLLVVRRRRHRLALLVDEHIISFQLLGERALDDAAHALELATEVLQLCTARRDRLLSKGREKRNEVSEKGGCSNQFQIVEEAYLVELVFLDEFVLLLRDLLQLLGEFLGERFELLPILDALLELIGQLLAFFLAELFPLAKIKLLLS